MSRTPSALGEAQRAEAVRLVRGGMSMRAVARRFGVSAPTIAKYLAAAPPSPPPAEQADAAPLGIDAGAPAIDIARALLAAATQGLEAARAAGDQALTQRNNRDAATLAILVARLEREHRDDREFLRIAREDIDAAMQSVREKAAAVCARPLQCATCSRRLSAALAGRLDPTPAA